MPRARDLFQISCVMPSDQLKTLATISGSDAQSVKPNQTSELSVLCFLFFGFDEPAIRTLCFSSLPNDQHLQIPLYSQSTETLKNRYSPSIFPGVDRTRQVQVL
ncbi:hypothetical protein MRB53_020836 [Persea americana]|uniref:Uncharacterized protein n=1 Tax=Persea americana TaxID=3435 RepID=A0ACC2L245_PERAE|nr:hypothetical protein MRB53_020836 [Persea americana]